MVAGVTDVAVGIVVGVSNVSVARSSGKAPGVNVGCNARVGAGGGVTGKAIVPTMLKTT